MAQDDTGKPAIKSKTIGTAASLIVLSAANFLLDLPKLMGDFGLDKEDYPVVMGVALALYGIAFIYLRKVTREPIR